MARRSQPKLLAQGKPRAPGAGTSKYQVFFRTPTGEGEGEPWQRVLRRAASEDEARKPPSSASATSRSPLPATGPS